MAKIYLKNVRILFPLNIVQNKEEFFINRTIYLEKPKVGASIPYIRYDNKYWFVRRKSYGEDSILIWTVDNEWK